MVRRLVCTSPGFSLGSQPSLATQQVQPRSWFGPSPSPWRPPRLLRQELQHPQQLSSPLPPYVWLRAPPAQPAAAQQQLSLRPRLPPHSLPGQQEWGKVRLERSPKAVYHQSLEGENQGQSITVASSRARRDSEHCFMAFTSLFYMFGCIIQNG